MMHSKNVVCAIKVNGKVLREDGDTVQIPFNSEFSVLLKNLDSVRQQISVSIDGTDVGYGTRFILAPNSSLELERFVKSNSTGNRFKFIERTAGVEAHRGIGAEDGLIRVEAWKEKAQRYIPVPIPQYYDVPVPRYPCPVYPRYPRWDHPRFGPNIIGSAGSPTGPLRSAPIRSQMQAKSASKPGASSGRKMSARIGGSGVRSFSMQEQERSNDAGITVPGSESHQHFQSVSGFPLEPQSVVIVLKLRGEVGGKVVVKPVTVSQKPTCATCGKTSKAGMQFCGACGTALEIFA